MPLSNRDVVYVLLALFFPPLSVLLKRGCGIDFCINFLLSILGFIPGKSPSPLLSFISSSSSLLTLFPLSLSLSLSPL
ncbi:MAG: hypothetical protein DHS80DRAFT_15812 [Piptocephalis tieghemiana]|nr:MAG: hypothetical protein DHS80DRAFT_15812 [Piptocephalis tieghemiana]